MQTRDSRATKLTPPEIVTMAIQNDTDAPEMVARNIVAAFTHMAHGNPMIDHIGNSVFVVHRGKKNTENVQGRMYNVEPAPMLVKNMIKHLRNLHEQGIRRYKGVIHSDALLTILKRMAQTAKREGFRMNIGAVPARDRDETYLVLIEILGDAETEQ